MLKGMNFVQVLALWCLLITFFLILLVGCASNTLLLETKVNDPIMTDLLDNDADVSQIEDGTGLIGEAATCPT